MKKVSAICGDITQMKVDAIVNAANQSLLGGGGVDGAIHRAAGPELLKACRRLNGCETGMAKITQGFKLPAKYIIHTVGPVWGGGDSQEDALLYSCYEKSLQCAVDNHIKTIAFPAISCGIYHFPVDRAASIAIKAVSAFLTKNSDIRSVTFVCFSDEIYAAYQALLKQALR